MKKNNLSIIFISVFFILFSFVAKSQISTDEKPISFRYSDGIVIKYYFKYLRFECLKQYLLKATV